MDNRDADWRPASGTTSGGVSIGADERDDILASLFSVESDMLPVSPGSWGRDLLISVFGVSSDTITALQSKFSGQRRRCHEFGSEVGPWDIAEAIARYGS